MEKEKAIAEKRSRMKQEEENVPVPRKAKKVIRMPSPDASQEIIQAAPFRSDSPPLPAVLKKMKEENSLSSSQQIASTTQSPNENISSQGQSESFRSSQNEIAALRRSANYSRQSTRSARRQSGNEEDNREILAQLQAIQRELQNEDRKIQEDLKAQPSLPSITQAERIRFEHDIEEMGKFIIQNRTYVIRL